jgi:hypothetical protein
MMKSSEIRSFVKMSWLPSFLVFLSLVNQQAYGSEDTENERDKGWEHSILTYLWTAGVDGDAAIGPLETDVDIDFSDLKDKLSLGGSLIYEGWNDRWGVVADVLYMRIEDEVGAGMTEIDTTTDMVVAELGVGLKIKGKFPALFLGVRYMGFELEIDAAVGSREREFDGFIDPIVGIYYRKEFNHKWGMRLLADVGGFGVGTEFSWGLGIGAFRQFKQNWYMEGGLRVINIDYDDDVEFDGTLSGLYVGVGKRFGRNKS